MPLFSTRMSFLKVYFTERNKELLSAWLGIVSYSTKRSLCRLENLFHGLRPLDPFVRSLAKRRNEKVGGRVGPIIYKERVSESKREKERETNRKQRDKRLLSCRSVVRLPTVTSPLFTPSTPFMIPRVLLFRHFDARCATDSPFMVGCEAPVWKKERKKKSHREIINCRIGKKIRKGIFENSKSVKDYDERNDTSFDRKNSFGKMDD